MLFFKFLLFLYLLSHAATSFKVLPAILDATKDLEQLSLDKAEAEARFVRMLICLLYL